MKKPTETQSAHWEKHFPLNERESAVNELDPAWAAFARRMRTHVHHRRDPRRGLESIGCQDLREVAAMLEALRESADRGEKAAVFDALLLAASEGVPLPYWLAEAVCRWPAALSNIRPRAAKPPNLHTALGLQHRYPLSLAAAKKMQTHRELGMKLAQRTQELVGSGMKQTPARKQAAEEEGVPRTTAANRINEYVDAQMRSPWTAVLEQREPATKKVHVITK